MVRNAHYRTNSRPRYKKRTTAERSKGRLAETVIRQSAISIILLLLVFFVKTVDMPLTNTLLDKLKWVAFNNVEIDKIFSTIDEIIDSITRFKLPFTSGNAVAADKGFESQDYTNADDDESPGMNAMDGMDARGLAYLRAWGIMIPESATGIPNSSQAASSAVLPVATPVASSVASSAAMLVATPVSTPAATPAATPVATPKSVAAAAVKPDCIAPVTGLVVSCFGNRMHPILKKMEFHSGIDIDVPTGTPIKAFLSGKVISAGWENGYGYCVRLEHSGGLNSVYAHCSKVLVKKGQQVDKGATIANVGSTGLSTGPHLHFEIRKGEKAVDPLSYINLKKV